jgi:protein lifeguard
MHTFHPARVYAILACQLIVTAVTIYVFGTHPEITSWMSQPRGLGAFVPIVSLVLSTIAWIVMSISTQARRVAPMKWQLLALFTIGEAISVGFVSSFYNFRSVAMTMMVTALATTSISVYTVRQRNSKYDLSQWGATLSSFGLIMVIYGIVQILQYVGVLPAGFLPYNEKLYGLVGATLFSGYLAYHTKTITAGKDAKHQMNENDYVFGASYVFFCELNLFHYFYFN